MDYISRFSRVISVLSRKKMIGSELFYSMIVEGKKEFLKKLSIIRINDTFSTFLLGFEFGFSFSRSISFKEVFVFVYFVKHC